MSYDPTEKFKFDLPSGWSSQTVYYFRGPKEDDNDHQIIMTINPKPQHDSVESFAKESIRIIERSLDGTETLKNEEVTGDGVHPVWEFVYKWIPSDEITFMQKYVFVLAGGLGFTFTCQFTKKSYKTVGLQLKDVIDAVLPGTYNPIEVEEED